MAQKVKNLPAVVPGLGRSLEKEIATLSGILAWNSMDRGAWWATVYGVTKSQTQLSNTHTSQIELPSTMGLLNF